MNKGNLNVPQESFLRARDPSILAFNRPHDKARANLINEFGEPSQVIPEEQKVDEPENIRVYLRVKQGELNPDIYSVDKKAITTKIPPNLVRNAKEGENIKKTYTFSEIFPPETKQKDIFEYVVKPRILDFINGQNMTVMTYGTSGSGKTFTIIGTDEDPGIVPRSLEYLFRTLPKLSKEAVMVKPTLNGATVLNSAECQREIRWCKTLLQTSSSIDRTHHLKTYQAMQQRLSGEPVAQLDKNLPSSVNIWVSFAEIYNESIYDMLEVEPRRGQPRPKHRLVQIQGNAYIKDLRHINVTSGQEAYQILQHGLHNVNFAATELNKHSSRSHSIFTIKLVQLSKPGGEALVSSLTFCDLAGSERTKKTLNVGDRLKESNNINTSLLVLGRCISSVRESQRDDRKLVVPYRESKLTQLFQKALMGSEDLAIITTINGCLKMFEETQHILEFAAVCKEIKIEKPVPKPVKYQSRFTQLVLERERSMSRVEEEGEDEEAVSDIIWQLKEQLQIEKNEYETTQQINLDYLHKEYQQLLKEQEVYLQSKINSLTAQMRTMRREYEEEIMQLKKNQVIVIDDDSSEEDDKETLEEAISEYQELKEKFHKAEEENLSLKAQLMQVEEERDLLKLQMNAMAQSSDEEETPVDKLPYSWHEEEPQQCSATNNLKEFLDFLKDSD